MAIIEEKDQVATGLARLATVWVDKPKVNGLLKSYLENIQEVQDVYFELLNNRSLTTAIGAQLDVIGLIVGQRRSGDADEDFRNAIKLRIAINNSDGTEPTISSLMQQLSGATSIIFEVVLPAKIKVTLVDVLVTLPDETLADILGVVPSGVGLDLIHGPGSVEFSAANYNVGEEDGSVEITINRNGGFFGPISGFVTPVIGTAGGGDLVLTPQPFSMANNVSSTTVDVDITQDIEVEVGEIATLIFTSLVNTFAFGQTTSQITIIDDDSTVDFSAANYDVDEDAGSVIVTVNRTGTFTGTVSGTIQLVPDAPAAIGDFSGAPYNFSMADGVSSDAVSIGIVDNAIFEADKTAQLSFISLVNTVASGQTTSQITVLEDEPDTVVSIITNLSATVAEGSSYTLTISRTGNTGFPVTVDLEGGFTGGAIEGVDYDTLPATLTIATGQVTESLVVNITIDAVSPESGENFDLIISNATVGTVNPSFDTANITITDVPQSTVAMTVSSKDVDEGSSISIFATRTGSLGTCSVDVTTTVGAGSATNSDFENTSKTISWANGETGSKSVSFTTADNGTLANDVTFDADLDTPVDCSITGSGLTTVTIVDDEIIGTPTLFNIFSFRNVTSGSGFATCRVIVGSDGTLEFAKNDAGSDALTNTGDIGVFWHKDEPSGGVGSGFEVKFDITAGPTGPGTNGASVATGVWLSLSSDKIFEMVSATVTSAQGLVERDATVSISIRNNAQTIFSNVGSVRLKPSAEGQA